MHLDNLFHCFQRLGSKSRRLTDSKMLVMALGRNRLLMPSADIALLLRNTTSSRIVAHGLALCIQLSRIVLARPDCLKRTQSLPRFRPSYSSRFMSLMFRSRHFSAQPPFIIRPLVTMPRKTKSPDGYFILAQTFDRHLASSLRHRLRS
jgi:hypothetical protein